MIKFPEGPGKITHLLKTALGGHVGDGYSTRAEQLRRPLKAVLLNVPDGRDPDGIFKAAETFAVTDQGALCNLGYSEFFGKMAVDVLKHNLNPFAFPQGFFGWLFCF